MRSFFACDGSTRDRRAARGQDFVSDPDHLYFLNIRSRDYHSETVAEGTDVYRHDELTSGDGPVIVDRWLEDRAELVWKGLPIPLPQIRELRDSLRRGDRSAALEVVEDYLRLVGK
ncbi:hypothetical protein [Lewinella sp. JB7]|uniref:hypothetical protein n=1 Tax=Lewinella sp. JB7 TaxID=2962887 RepID=UPI0020C93E8F|nr:hypothetical protein [Lewinella sp. JB7]MCP9237807.1 hypothetical protein [Lewinella sp. JB7]